jgi:UDP-N-acetylmuramoyl-L-alanyl-D-glutamate--2,6-diaminopimelate ligase
MIRMGEIARRCACPVVTSESGALRCSANQFSSVNGIAYPHYAGRELNLLPPLGRSIFQYPAAAAAGAARTPFRQSSPALKTTHRPGSHGAVENRRGITCLVDYAHTGDALENVLVTLKIASGRIITCSAAGDRDNGKRPYGEDRRRHERPGIVTSDNPRTEDR